jgi:hypothetical protein
LLLIAALCAPRVAQSAEILGTVLDEETTGMLRIGVRGSEGKPIVIHVNGQAVEFTERSRTRTRRWQPLIFLVDRTNVVPDGLDKIKNLVLDRARARFEAEAKLGEFRFRGEPPLIIVADQAGQAIAVANADTVETGLKFMVSGWEAEVSTDPRKRVISQVSEFLEQVLAQSGGRAKAFVFSSFCVGKEAKIPDLTKFNGRVVFLTWDQGIDKKCKAQRSTWLEAVQKQAGENLTVVTLFKAETRDDVKKALLDVDLIDEIVHVTGVPYEGGEFDLRVSAAGVEKPWAAVFVQGDMPHGWVVAAEEAKSKVRRLQLWGALAIFVIVLGMAALLRARASAEDMAKWEAVGEAEEVATALDEDAWAATIFQLTGVMPALKDVAKAAQLGPPVEEEKTKLAPPKGPAPSPPSEPAPKAPPKAPAGATGTTSAAKTPPPPSTGLTVSMPVLDDGTAYAAERPFEVGVLLNGRPVARRTKKFRKVFSVGRATDNRVVIQRDDTVHRYHVVIRPALEGKEWWLEVSPTASNRTNLNGKDLRPGGRYRLPDRFRLQLGEATEIRGRLAAA